MIRFLSTSFLALILAASALGQLEMEPDVVAPAAPNRLNIPRTPVKDPPPPDVQVQMEKFFLSLQNNQTKEAYEALLTGSDLENKQLQLNELIEKTTRAIQEIGPMTAYELLDSRIAGTRLVSVTYFSYHDKKPLRWRFIFYASLPDQWRLINHSVDDLISEAFLRDR
jgi:hypothetical protein